MGVRGPRALRNPKTRMVNQGYGTRKQVEAKNRPLRTRLPSEPCTRAVSPALKIRTTNDQLLATEGKGPRGPRAGRRAGSSGRRPLPSLWPARPRVPAPRGPGAPPPRRRHTSAPAPVARRRGASRTRAPHQHTPSPRGPPGAAALPGPRLRVPPRRSRGSGTFCSFLFRTG